MSLISSDIDGFQSLWYPSAYAKLSPTYKLGINDYLSSTKLYMSCLRFVQKHATFHPKSKKSKEGDKYHQIWIAIKHFNKAVT